MFYKNIKNHAEQFLSTYKSENPATFSAAEQAIGGLLILDGFVGINNPLGGKKRSGIFGSLICIVVGLALVLETGLIGDLFGINRLTATTTATVASVRQPAYTNTGNNNNSNGGTCTVQARYTVNGKLYTRTALNVSNSFCSLKQGQNININYDPNNPGAFAYDLSTVKTILIVGGIIFIISLVTFAHRLFSIIFGWKLLKNGRVLAKTLPAGTDLSTIKNEIRHNFTKSVFGMGMGMGIGMSSQTLIPQPPLQTPPPQQNITPPTDNPTIV